jgi:prepilin-type N-terminal cleavage/methylation domain-containing protein
MKQPRVTRNKKNQFIGFTLIEVLVVLVIISVVTAGVLLTVRHNRSWDERLFSENLSETLSLAQEYAILQSTTLKVVFHVNKIDFYQLKIDDKSQNSYWMKVQDTPLHSIIIPSIYQIQLQLPTQVLPADQEDEDEDEKDQDKLLAEDASSILMTMSGDWTPFVLLVGEPDKLPLYRIVGSAGGGISMHAL